MVSRNWKVTAFFNGIDVLVRTEGGKVLKHESWGKRHLAYHIKGRRTAYFYCLHLVCDVELLPKIRTEFRNNPAILRHLVVKQPGKPSWVRADDSKPKVTQTVGTLAQLTANNSVGNVTQQKTKTNSQ